MDCPDDLRPFENQPQKRYNKGQMKERFWLLQIVSKVNAISLTERTAFLPNALVATRK